MKLQQDLLEPITNSAADLSDFSEGASAVSDNASVPIRVRIVDLFSDYVVTGVLLSFIPGEVAILVDETLSEDREVAVWLNSFSFEGRTLYCRPRGSQYEAHISIDDLVGAGLRKTPRFPVMIPAELQPLNGYPVHITIRDLSREGMGIESPILLKAGQPIAVISGPAFVFGIVRYCKQLPGGRFRAGAEMHHLFEKPAHSPVQPPATRQPKWFRNWSKKLLSFRNKKSEELLGRSFTEVGS